MLSTTSLPVLGAALPLDGLAQHRDWILEKQRDLEIQDFFRAEVLDGDWRETARSIRNLLDGYTGRLGIHGPFWGFKIDSQDPLIREVVAKRFQQGLDACEAIGATQMVIHSPCTTWEYNNNPINPGGVEAQIERVHQTIGEVVKRAKRLGVELVIENIEDKDPAMRVAMAASFGEGVVKVSIDTGHAHYAHVSTGAPPVDYYVTAAGNALAHVHLQDGEGYSDRHWAPGEGTINWQGVFRALSGLSSNPRLIIEIKDKTAVQKAAAYLAGLGLAQ
ncbi:sugar phosphate isomerase/epimerase family protein [Terrarubrum flagellatum]|uniref:sugar phosphate isomerase/epimerase family protein n=1 Tax=Terrirubrum flagellatum TaxID=2895980 RepID=UPI0031455B6B